MIVVIIMVVIFLVDFVLKSGPHGVFDRRVQSKSPKYLAGSSHVIATVVGPVHGHGLGLKALPSPNGRGILDVQLIDEIAALI